MVWAAKQQATVDPRQVACRLPVASQWAASGPEAEYFAESYSEPVSLLERPMAEARARAKQQRRLRQYPHLQSRRWKAMISPR